MAGKLAERLKRIRDAEGGRRTVSPGAFSDIGDVLPPPGWERRGPGVLERSSGVDVDFPEEADIGPFLVPRLLPLSAPSGSGPLLARRETLGFIDTETTGLSTGAGTYVFAFGIGRFEGRRFRVLQLFLEDYPGEADFIDAVSAALAGVERIVSYNGKSFDVPLLRTRFAMNGKRFPDRGQLDLLHTARRLWAKACGGSSLREVEERILGLPRADDVPGSEAPERYLGFLRSGSMEGVLPVLEHHLKDIASLPVLMARALETFSRPLDDEAADRLRLGLILYRGGRSSWESCLLDGAGRGDAAAGRALARIYKREGRWKDAMDVLAALEIGIDVLVEMAIIAEHRIRNYAAAIEYCERALALDPEEPGLGMLIARMARLKRKSEYR
jgi:uncharacterized protein